MGDKSQQIKNWYIHIKFDSVTTLTSVKILSTLKWNVLYLTLLSTKANELQCTCGISVIYYRTELYPEERRRKTSTEMRFLCYLVQISTARKMLSELLPTGVAGPKENKCRSLGQSRALPLINQGLLVLHFWGPSFDTFPDAASNVKPLFPNATYDCWRLKLHVCSIKQENWCAIIKDSNPRDLICPGV